MATVSYADYRINFGDFGTQATFNAFVEDAGAVATYRAMAVAEPSGLTGFDIAIATSAVKINSELWNLVTVGSDYNSDYIYTSSIRVRKGLPLNIDVGASYTAINESGIGLFGAEIQWAILEGSVATPAIALRGHYSELFGVDDFDLQTYGIDAVVSKGFAMITPYAGIGAVYTKGEYTDSLGIQSVALESYDFTTTRFFGGARITFAPMWIIADVEWVEQPVYSLKFGIGW
jgi:hypothetical protein